MLSGAAFSMLAPDDELLRLSEDVLVNAPPKDRYTKIFQLRDVLRQFAQENGFALSFDGRQKEEYMLFCTVEACTKAWLYHARVPAAQAAYNLNSAIVKLEERHGAFGSVMQSYYGASQKISEDMIDKWLNENMRSLWCTACSAAEKEKRLISLHGDIHEILHKSASPLLEAENPTIIGQVFWIRARRCALNILLSNGLEIFDLVFKEITSKAAAFEFSHLPPLGDLPWHKICSLHEGEMCQPWPFIYYSRTIFLFFLGQKDADSAVFSFSEELVRYIILFVIPLPSA
jgi:hypothetical protein